MQDGVLPNHTAYEEGILGAVINEPALYDDVSRKLSHGDFYSERNAGIFRAMGELREAGAPIHIVTLWERLDETGALEDAGGSSYLTYLSEVAFLDDSIGYYIDTVRDDAEKRAAWRLFAEGARSVEKGDGWERIDEIKAALIDGGPGRRGESPMPVSARDLADVPAPEPLWADVLYPGSIVQLNSEPGAGKSTLAYNICALGACGEPFVGIPFSKRLKSLYVDLETPRFLRRNKIELICGELPADFYIIDNITLRSDFSHLLSLCKRGRYDLLVLDTQSRVLAMEKENDNSKANHLMGLLRRIANEAGCAILLIHHTTKGDEGKAVYRGRGASAIAGAADVVVNLQTVDEETLKLSVVKHRIQGSNPALFIRKAGEDRFEPCPAPEPGGESGFEMFRVQDFIKSMLSERDEPTSTKEIRRRAYDEGIKERTVERALSRMRQAGLVRQTRLGFNVLTLDDDSAAND